MGTTNQARGMRTFCGGYNRGQSGLWRPNQKIMPNKKMLNQQKIPNLKKANQNKKTKNTEPKEKLLKMSKCWTLSTKMQSFGAYSGGRVDVPHALPPRYRPANDIHK